MAREVRLSIFLEDDQIDVAQRYAEFHDFHSWRSWLSGAAMNLLGPRLQQAREELAREALKSPEAVP